MTRNPLPLEKDIPVNRVLSIFNFTKQTTKQTK